MKKKIRMDYNIIQWTIEEFYLGSSLEDTNQSNEIGIKNLINEDEKLMLKLLKTKFKQFLFKKTQSI